MPCIRYTEPGMCYVPPSGPPHPPTHLTDDELEEVEELFMKGDITEEEYFRRAFPLELVADGTMTEEEAMAIIGDKELSCGEWIDVKGSPP